MFDSRQMMTDKLNVSFKLRRCPNECKICDFALEESFECSRLKTICLDNIEDEPLLLSKETSPEEKEEKYQQMDVESKESAFQRHGAHHRFISSLTSDVCVNKIHLILTLLKQPVYLRICPLTFNCEVKQNKMTDPCMMLFLNMQRSKSKLWVYPG